MFDSVNPGYDGIERLSDTALESEIVGVSARIASAMCRWLGLIAEFDRRQGHEGAGFHCCSAWLAWACSISPRSAREHVRVANALEDLRRTRAAMANGDLSYSKARVLTRIATPELEEDLVELALQTTAAQLECVARTYRRVMSAADADLVHERRFLSYSWESDGSLSIRGSLTAEDGAVLLKALDAGREAIREEVSDETLEAEGGSAEPPHLRAPINADALVRMAESHLARGSASRSNAERAQVLVHVDAIALAGDASMEEQPSTGAAPARCEVADGASISPETARRICCDGSRVVIADGRSGPLDVGRHTRAVPSAMRRALSARDGGCRFPGCTNHRWAEAHHIVHWAHGGETSTENLVELCRRHHRLVHEGGFKLNKGPDGEVRFWRPDGTLIENGGGRTPHHHARRHRLAPLRKVSGDPAPRSRGEKLDIDYTATVLASRSGESASMAARDP